MTVTKTLMRKGFMFSARYSGLASVLSPVLSGMGAIMMLHRVGPCPDSLCINGFLSIDPDFLDQLLDQLKRDGIRFVSLDETIDRLKAGHSDERFTSVTLDDGYQDNFESAVPIFSAHNVPYTIYLCPGFIDGYAHLWWENLANIIEQQDQLSYDVPEGRGSIDCATPAEKRAAYKHLMAYLCNEVDEKTQRQIVDRLCDDYGLDAAAHVRANIMSWDTLKGLSEDPLCTFGAHTLNHYHLRRLERDEALYEMSQSAEVLKEKLGLRPGHFAYPYGAEIAAGPREVEMAREIGFKSAVTTRHGLLHAEHGQTLLALPRISINGNYQRVDYIRTMLSGIAVPLANKGKRIVTV